MSFFVIVGFFLIYLVLERVNMRLHKDLDTSQQHLDDIEGVGMDKLNKENERLRELFKRAELDW